MSQKDEPHLMKIFLLFPQGAWPSSLSLHSYPCLPQEEECSDSSPSGWWLESQK